MKGPNKLFETELKMIQVIIESFQNTELSKINICKIDFTWTKSIFL